MEENKTVIHLTNGGVHLGEMWGRLDILCRKLWQEDRAVAASLQAVIEEFRGEVARAEQMITAFQQAIQEQRQTLQTELSSIHQREVAVIREQLEGARKQLTPIEEALVAEKRRNQQLMKELGAREATVVEFKDAGLKTEAELVGKYTKMMQELHNEIQQKEKELETYWQGRVKATEEELAKEKMEYKQKTAQLVNKEQELLDEHKDKESGLEKKYQGHLEEIKQHAVSLEEKFNKKEIDLLATYTRYKQELEVKENQLHKKDDELHRREEELIKRSHQLEEEYNQKRQEMDGLKKKFQEEVGLLVAEYQSKKTEYETKLKKNN